jgi:hypothetical protein
MRKKKRERREGGLAAEKGVGPREDWAPTGRKERKGGRWAAGRKRKGERKRGFCFFQPFYS